MISSTITELIFSSSFSVVNIDFLFSLISDANEIRFNEPEFSSPFTAQDVLKNIYSNEYIDLVIITDKLEINGKIVKNVFINVGRNSDDFELLFYFDIKDLEGTNYKSKIEDLKNWADYFQNRYNFHYYIAQMDNAGDNEYYFDSNGWGPLYDNKLIE